MPTRSGDGTQSPTGPESVLQAIKEGEEDEVERLMEDAAKNGRELEFTRWAEYDGNWDTGEHTLLHWACDVGALDCHNKKPSLRIVQKLLSKGFSPNARGQGGAVPLQLISKSNDDEAGRIIEYLLERNDIRPNAVNEYGYTALHEAAAWGSPIAVKSLIDGGANLNLLTVWGESPLGLAHKRKRQSTGEEAKDRYQEVINTLEQRKRSMRDEIDKLCSKYKGFFYWGNRHSAPKPPMQMTVKDMLDHKELSNRHRNGMEHHTRWFHLPANNRGWIEAMVSAILNTDDPGPDRKSYRKSVETEVHRIMEDCNTYTRSRHPARSFRAIFTGPDGTEEERYIDRYDYASSSALDNGRVVVSLLSVPMIESDIYVGEKDGDGEQSQLSKSIRERREDLNNLCNLYPGNVFPRQSLDGFYYEGLDHSAIKGRDLSQVYSKQGGDTPKRILYVGQLWALWIGHRTLITASQGDWSGADIQSPARRYARKSRPKTGTPIDIFYELQELCVDLVNHRVACDLHSVDDRTISVHRAFSHAITQVSNDIKDRYERYMLHARKQELKAMTRKAQMMCDQARLGGNTIEEVVDNHFESKGSDEVFVSICHESERQNQAVADTIRSLVMYKPPEDSGRQALEVRDDIGTESEKLSQIMDVIDELNIINTVLEEQYEGARWSMSHKDVRDFIRDVRPAFTGLLRESERVRMSVIELLRLREQEIAIRNAVETTLSAEEQASTKIAATVFTVTPFSFGFSILGSGIGGMSPEYSIGTAILAMALTLIATVALLMFLIPILTVIKKPWSQWIYFVTNATKNFTRGDGTSDGRPTTQSLALHQWSGNGMHSINRGVAVSKQSSPETSTSSPILWRRLTSRKALRRGDPEG
ncbi:hypothetical protein SCUP515_12985 [Seiridium cupressi]